METWGAIDVYQKYLECLVVFGPVWKQTFGLFDSIWTCCTKPKTLYLISADNPLILASWLEQFSFSYFCFENTAAFDLAIVCSWASVLWLESSVINSGVAFLNSLMKCSM